MPPPYGPSWDRRPVVWIRNDTTGTWPPTYPAAPSRGGNTTRTIVDHVDTVTGIHHVFVGFGGASNRFVRGGYNATTGLIDWEIDAPELTGSERMLSAGECNGVLYACIGSNGTEGDNVGGIFWRQDGSPPQWHFVCEWPTNSANPDIRGFTAVPHPKGFDYDVALVTLESYGKVYCIDPIGGDPRNGHIVTEELNIQTFLGDDWYGGASIGFPTLSAYNDMPELIHPGTKQPVNLIGVAVKHPDSYGTEKGNSSYYLIRHRDATYEWGRVFDPAEPLPNNDADEHGLRATRASRLSPFPEDCGRVIFFSGFDAAAQIDNTYHNTSWIYRGELPGGRIKLSTNAVTISETATNLTIEVSRIGSSTGVVSVDFASANGTAQAGSDFTGAFSTLTWNDGDATNKTITVPIAKDSLPEGSETFTLSLANPTGGAACGVFSNLTVTILDAPYDDWRFAHFTSGELLDPAISGHHADPDGDGSPNLLEFALNTDPRTANSSAFPVITSAADNGTNYLTLTATKNPAATDIQFSAEVSADLNVWTNDVTVLQNDLTTFKARDNIPIPDAVRRFMRLKVTAP
jgi:hypothetical protein